MAAWEEINDECTLNVDGKYISAKKGTYWSDSGVIIRNIAPQICQSEARGGYSQN